MTGDPMESRRVSDRGNPFAPPLEGAVSAQQRADADQGLPEGVLDALRRTRPWLIVLSVFSYLTGAASAVLTVLHIVELAQNDESIGALALSGLRELAVQGGLAAVGILVGAVLWSCARRVRDVLEEPSLVQLEKLLDRYRTYFKIVGLVALVAGAIVLLSLLLVFLAFRAFS